ncbi:GTP cyclohydrolase II [Streptomyces sp. NPDC057651]|uniref:GTP cyclohydrolase II n=1 Tax=Streptomyces sp. NPDC057651 TaxID=3346194 RepID=UPI003698AAF5
MHAGRNQTVMSTWPCRGGRRRSWALPWGVLVRAHGECLTGDILGSLRCDCGKQLEHAMPAVPGRAAAQSSTRVDAGHDIGLPHRIRSPTHGMGSFDTVEVYSQDRPVAPRIYGVGAQILGHFRNPQTTPRHE